VPVVWSRALVFSGEIWCYLVESLLWFLLRWLEVLTGASSPAISNNKPRVLQILSATLLLLLLLAGHGGEGERHRREAADRFGGWQGFSFAQVRWRGAGRRLLDRTSTVLPRWKKVEIFQKADPLNKRLHRPLSGLRVIFPLSAGRGGEEEEVGYLGSSESWRWCGEDGVQVLCAPEAESYGGAHQLRLWSAEAIFWPIEALRIQLLP
jgi:hypothetical protein